MISAAAMTNASARPVPARPQLAGPYGWMTHPANRWTFQRITGLLPTVRIDPDPDRRWPLAEDPQDLDRVRVALPGSRATLADFLDRSCTDGLIVLHRGRITCERYRGGMEPGTRHHTASVSKSVTGLVTAILAGQKLIAPGRAITDYLPGLTDGAYRGATVADLLDMRASVSFGPSYAHWARFISAAGWHLPDGAGPHEDLVGMARTLPGITGARHGSVFAYNNCNPALLALICEQVTGLSFARCVGQLLWRPLGAGYPAEAITGGRGGSAGAAAAGLQLTLRDCARIGELVRCQGAGPWGQVVPPGWIAALGRGPVPLPDHSGAFTAAYDDPGYRGLWWSFPGQLAAIGAFGQLIAVHPDHEVTVAMLSSEPGPWDLAADRTRLRVAAALAGTLAGRPGRP
jgi:CubicO group peptidase (beta-lactamase class C family)